MHVNDEILTGELGRMCGVSADTIRHYERVGVLPAAVRGANGYRYHPRAAAARVMLIRRALAIGFSLAELARIVEEWDDRLAATREGEAALLLEQLPERKEQHHEETTPRPRHGPRLRHSARR